jgi:uncharacterized protein
MFTQESRVLAFIVGGSLVVSFGLLGLFYYSAQAAATRDALSVTGSAKTQVTADQVKLIIAMSRIVPASALSGGYASIARDLALSRTLLKSEGVTDELIVESPVSANQIYDYNNQGGETRYELRQTITAQSDDVAKLTAVSKKIPSLASQGAFVSIQSLEYYYSKLPELRVSLLGEAVKDAEARAAKIAESTGRKVGDIRSAASGVVQVLPRNSIEVSDYGSYDTSSIEKDVMVTVKASFGIR